MKRVVVIEFDETLRGTLHVLLSEVGHYAVTEVTMESESLDLLAAAPAGVVAICSNVDADHHRSAAFFAAVVADACLALRHQYLLLSTHPASMPNGLRLHLHQLGAPVVSKPFEMETLLSAVDAAMARLVHGHTLDTRRDTSCEVPRCLTSGAESLGC